MKTICVTTLSVMLLTAFCGGAFGAEHCRPTGELQEKLAKGNDASANSVADSAKRAEKEITGTDPCGDCDFDWGSA